MSDHQTDTSNEAEEVLNPPSREENLPSSQFRREMVLTRDTSCGIGFIRGKWLQRFANKKAFLVVYGALGCFYAAYYVYFTGTITTMEKRFKIPSRVMGFIAAGGDMVTIFTSPLLTYYVTKGHRPRWIGLGAYCAVLSSLLWASMHLLYGAGDGAMQLTREYAGSNSSNSIASKVSKLCVDEAPACTASKAEGVMPILLLLLTQLILGGGSCLHYTLGTTYLDDNIKKTKTHAVISFSLIIKMIGPAFGYWLSSTSLKVFVAPTLTPTITEEDTRWIGAYWLGSIIIGLLIFIFASILMLFPKRMPKAVERGKSRLNRRSLTSDATDFKGLIATFKRLLCNPTYNYNNISSVFYAVGFMAYWVFLPKYIETQYHQSASTANFVTGTISVIFTTGGIFVSSLALSRFQPSARLIAAWNIVIMVVSCVCIVSFSFLGCPANDLQSSLTVHNNADNCYVDCHCDFVAYSPVCGENQQMFISPCHAGCRSSTVINGTKLYTDCGCIRIGNLSGSAKEGPCPVECQTNFYLFVALFCLINFICATGYTSSFLIQLRCVEERDKSVSLGLNITMLCLFALLPAPVLFGYIMDTTCLFWGASCDGNKGNCWLYDSSSLRLTMNATSAGFLAISTITQLGIWYHVKDLQIFDDNSNQTKKQPNLDS